MLESWREYPVGKPSDRLGWVEKSCTPFETVSHISHWRQALCICRDGVIKPRVICDESRLKGKGITVVWLSPNDWHGGSRYGNVEFDFKLNQVLNRHLNFYWVETIPYRVPACRILITSKEYKLEVYNPEDGKGPWWFDRPANKHYRNGYVTLEFMLEDELALDGAAETRFIDHSDAMCCDDLFKCPDRGLSAWKAGAKFLAAYAGLGLPAKSLKLVDSCGDASNSLQSSWRKLGLKLYPLAEFQGTVTAQSAEANKLARVVMKALAEGDDAQCKQNANSFQSAEELVATCASVIEDTLSLPKDMLLPDL